MGDYAVNAIILSALLTQAMQAGAEAMAKAAGLPQYQYNQIVMDAKWRETMKAKRLEILKEQKRKDVRNKHTTP